MIDTHNKTHKNFIKTKNLLVELMSMSFTREIMSNVALIYYIFLWNANLYVKGH